MDVIIEVEKEETKANGRFNAGDSINFDTFDSMFDVKKFTALVAFNDELRNLYFDMAENQGIDSTWDVYHIQEGSEKPSPAEIQIMREIFENRILNNEKLYNIYLTSDTDFRANVRNKFSKRK